MTTPNRDASIKVKGLSYKFQDGTIGLSDINFDLPAGSRTLLIGGKPSHPNYEPPMYLPICNLSRRFLTSRNSQWRREVNSTATYLWQASCPDRNGLDWGS